MASTRANTFSRQVFPPKSPVDEGSYSNRVESFLSTLDSRGLLAVISLDNIRSIMRQHGLRGREAATKEFDARLRELARVGDGYFPISDDHVCLVLVRLFDHNHGLLAAHKLESLFAEPLALEGVKVPLVVRAGMVTFGGYTATRSADYLYRIAEVARESACGSGSCFELVTVEDLPTTEAPDLTPEFRKAMEDGLVTVDYQPKYRLRDGELVGAEALVRWRREGIVVPPDDFIPRLTREQIWEMTQYCIRRAIREMEGFLKAVPIALNIDPTVLDNPDFAGFIRRELRLWSIEPEQLTFEITESATIDDYDHTHELLSQLRSNGHRVSIDDFGTGQATLEHFKNLPADEIKIDRQFITNIVTNDDDRNITATIIEMAHRCHKTVVAEGIEDGHTVTQLIAMGCDVGQGFFLGMPMSREQFSTLVSGLSDSDHAQTQSVR